MSATAAGRRRTGIFIALGIAAALGLAFAAGRVAVGRGWQPPPWLGFLGRRAVVPEDAGLFCREHGVPEKFCTVCHAELKGRLSMCDEHGVPEAVCTLCDPGAEVRHGLTGICKPHGLPGHLCPRCHPELAGAAAGSDWCAVHSAPRSLCTRCDPGLADRIEMCREHGLPRALCTACRPELKANFPTCDRHRLPRAFCRDPECEAAAASGSMPAAALPRVRLKTPEVAARAGIATSPAVERPLSRTLEAPGEVGYDETRLVHVKPRLGGVIREVFVRTGDAVTASQVLAVIDSAELGTVKAEYLAALPAVELWEQTIGRQRQLKEKDLVAQKDLLASEAELRRARAALLAAEQRLRNFGLTDADLAGVQGEAPAARNRYSLVTPLAGTVVRRSAAPGESVGPESALFLVADLTRVWVHLDVYEKDLRSVAAGQAVRFQVPGLAPAEFSGKVISIDSQVDEHTRTVRVRAEVENTGGLLRANMFGTGRLEVGPPRTSLLVPREAVQWEGSSFVIFVRKNAAEYEPRRVLKGERVEDQVELVWAPLAPGDQVVTTGSFLLKTEIMKGSIGAGCCE